jgi:PBP1b-binding outer membrane lipoprotein LpoB
MKNYLNLIVSQLPNIEGLNERKVIHLRKKIKVICLILVSCLFLLGCTKKNDNSNLLTPTAPAQSGSNPSVTQAAADNNKAIPLNMTNYFTDQTQIDTSLLAEAAKKYKFEEPLVIVNPYGNSPLTAVAVFSTDIQSGGTITVKGKAKEDDIKGTFPASVDHIVPIYGLYPAAATEVVLTLDNGTSTTVSVTTDPIDMNTEGIKVEMSNSADYDYSKLTFILGLNSNIYAVDSKGDVRWYMKKNGTLGAKALENGHLILPSNYTLQTFYYQSGLMEMDLLGKVYREYAIPGGMHHDVVEMPNGNLLVASDRPSMETVEDYLVELDRQTGEVIWELDMKELINPTEGSSLNRTDHDWLHNNGIWYDEANDLVLISSRHTDAIIAVNKTDKTLKWILGDPEGWSEEYKKYFFTPIGDNFEWQYAQHQVSMLSNGDIMCFDNGAGRTKTTKPEKGVTGNNVFSRAVIFRINTDKMTIQQIWEYGKEVGPSVYSEWISGAIELNDDPKNIWVTFGANLYNPEKKDYDYGPNDMFIQGIVQSSKIVQVKDNKLVYKLTLPHLTYRTLREEPYADTGVYDVTAKGTFMGNLGVSQPAAATVDLTNAELNQDISFTLDPTKLTLKASYNPESAQNLPDSYLVLNKADGSNLVYKLTQSATTDKAGKVTASVNGWISTYGLEGQAYNIYAVLGGTAYNTGKQLDIKK